MFLVSGRVRWLRPVVRRGGGLLCAHAQLTLGLLPLAVVAAGGDSGEDGAAARCRHPGCAAPVPPILPPLKAAGRKLRLSSPWGACLLGLNLFIKFYKVRVSAQQRHDIDYGHGASVQLCRKEPQDGWNHCQKWFSVAKCGRKGWSHGGNFPGFPRLDVVTRQLLQPPPTHTAPRCPTPLNLLPTSCAACTQPPHLQKKGFWRHCEVRG